MPTPLTAAAADLTADLDRAFLAHGTDPGGDVDAAFDDAVDQAGYDHGFAGLVPSVASIDADQVTVTTTEPVTLARGLLLAARALHHDTLEAGVAYAVPICPDSTYKRRRVRLTLTDPALEIAETAGPLAPVTAGLERLLRETADAADAPIGDTELFESVQITTARHRYKPVTTPFKGKSAATFAILAPATGTLVEDGFRTAGDARRAAVALAKAGPVNGSATGHLEIVKVVRRLGGDPIARIDRTRVTSRVVAKVTVGTVKNPQRVKTAGWLFYGIVATPDAADDTGSDDGTPLATPSTGKEPAADTAS